MPIVTTINKLSQVRPPVSPEQLMERVCNHWPQRILRVLESAGDNTMAYAEIKGKLHPKSEKMYADALKELEAYGLICLRRNEAKSGTHNYDYRLTEQGRGLLAAIHQLQNWANDTHAQVVENTLEWNKDRKENYSLGK